MTLIERARLINLYPHALNSDDLLRPSILCGVDDSGYRHYGARELSERRSMPQIEVSERAPGYGSDRIVLMDCEMSAAEIHGDLVLLPNVELCGERSESERTPG